MAQLKIGQMCSQVRNILKANKQDSFLTDLEIYILFKKHVSPIMKRLDEKGTLTKFSSVFETLDWVELEEVDKVEAIRCGAPQSYSTFMRTKKEMPMFTEGVYGPMVNSITSLDGSTIFKMIRNSDIFNMISSDKNIKYNTTKYCWFLNDKIYFGNINYPAVRIEGIFEEDISEFKCCDEDRCKRRQDQDLNVPDFVLHDAIQGIMQDFGIELKVPRDIPNDNQSPLK